MPKIPATMPEHGSVRHHQAEAAVLLRTLLMVDLPGLYWQLRPHATGLILVGQLYGDDDATRRGIDEWAAYLDAEVQAVTHEDYVQIAAETVRDGVAVRVWGLLKVTFSYVKAPASAETGPLIDPDCRDGKCSSCVGGPCEHECHRDTEGGAA